MAPLVPLQKKVYVSILRKELPKLLALASGASNAQSLHNVVSISLPIQAYLFSILVLCALIFTLQCINIASHLMQNFPLLFQVIQLRKTCSHPYLFPGIEPEPYQEGEHLVQVF